MHTRQPKLTLDIKDVAHLCKMLRTDENELLSIANLVDESYSTLQITNNGKTRTVDNPNDLLKQTQRKINKILQGIHLPECVHGSIRGKSNTSNASVHCKANIVYCLDLKDFFPNISSRKVRYTFEKTLNCSPPVATLITKLATYKYKLPTGAPTSPAIANLLFREVDEKLLRISLKNKICYTRYVDDLTFSGKYISSTTRTIIKNIVASSGYTINKKKEKLLDSQSQKIVTGLNVGNSAPSVPKAYKIALRKEIFMLKKMERFGVHEDEIQALKSSLQGKISYIRNIEKKYRRHP